MTEATLSSSGAIFYGAIARALYLLGRTFSCWKHSPKRRCPVWRQIQRKQRPSSVTPEERHDPDIHLGEMCAVDSGETILVNT